MEQKRIIPITGEHLVKIFRDPKFIDNINKISLYKKGEAGFGVDQMLFKPEYRIMSIQYSLDYSSMKGAECSASDILLDDAPYENDSETDFLSIIWVHNHPSEIIPVPSTMENGGDFKDDFSGDLYGLCNEKGLHLRMGYNMKPIWVIIGERYNGKNNLLIIQYSLEGLVSNELLLEETIANLFEEFEEFNTADEVTDRLKGTNYFKAEMIGFSNRGYSKGDLEKIASFDYTPLI